MAEINQSNSDQTAKETPAQRKARLATDPFRGKNEPVFVASGRSKRTGSTHYERTGRTNKITSSARRQGKSSH